MSENDKIKSDYEYSRDTYYDLLEKGKNSLESMAKKLPLIENETIELIFSFFKIEINSLSLIKCLKIDFDEIL